MAANDLSVRRIGVRRLALTGAIAAALVFFLRWLGTFIPFSSPTHAYIGLFTLAEAGSGAALAEGLLWSFIFGGLSGAVIAIVYNLLRPLEPR